MPFAVAVSAAAVAAPLLNCSAIDGNARGSCGAPGASTEKSCTGDMGCCWDDFNNWCFEERTNPIPYPPWTPPPVPPLSAGWIAEEDYELPNCFGRPEYVSFVNQGCSWDDTLDALDGEFIFQARAPRGDGKEFWTYYEGCPPGCDTSKCKASPSSGAQYYWPIGCHNGIFASNMTRLGRSRPSFLRNAVAAPRRTRSINYNVAKTLPTEKKGYFLVQVCKNATGCSECKDPNCALCPYYELLPTRCQANDGTAWPFSGGSTAVERKVSATGSVTAKLTVWASSNCRGPVAYTTDYPVGGCAGLAQGGSDPNDPTIDITSRVAWVQ